MSRISTQALNLAPRADVAPPPASDAPAIYTLLFVVPSVLTFWFSFTKWQGLGTKPRYTGLRNYRAMVSNPVFLTAFRNTLLLVIAGGMLIFAVTFLSMIVLREMRGHAFV